MAMFYQQARTSGVGAAICGRDDAAIPPSMRCVWWIAIRDSLVTPPADLGINVGITNLQELNN
jgi:hypothetical protein